MIVLTYVGDCIIVGPSMVDIDAFVQSMKNGPERFVLTEEGDINKSIGIEITHIDEKRFKVSQPLIIDKIIYLLDIEKNDYGVDTNAKLTPVGKPLSQKDLSGKPRKEAWNYRTAVGMLNYLQGNNRTEMSRTVHQTSCFYNNQILSYEKAIKCFRRHLLHTKKEDII